jgi:ADP-ribosylglycohydrolase
MRVAPVGLFGRTFDASYGVDRVFEDGCMCAGLTHGHPSGYLTAGVLAVVIFEALHDKALPDALNTARTLLAAERGHEETLAALDKAIELSGSGKPHHIAIRQLGEGWVAEEALAISVYCALVAENFEQGIVLAVNHDGDSDSTGAITGNILGAMQGMGVIPPRWLEPLELREVIEAVASDLWTCSEWTSYMGDEGLWDRYPGS